MRKRFDIEQDADNRTLQTTEMHTANLMRLLLEVALDIRQRLIDPDGHLKD